VNAGTIAVLALLLIAVAIGRVAVRFPRDYQRLVIFRLGRMIGAKGPGFVFVIPAIDQAMLVDFRENVLEIPHQTCITKDNAAISIDFLVYSRVQDAVTYALQPKQPAAMVQGLASTTLRAVVGDLSLDDVLAQRERINESLRSKLDQETERWGVKITLIEILEILPPREVQDAMTRQMAAERERRAMVTEAAGRKEAAIAVAEGSKQAAILEAEGQRQSAILRAEGFALALDTVNAVARGIDTRTLSLQYLDALKQLGASDGTKIVLPLELTNLLQPIAAATGQNRPA
jgi:regulator of protease activity HflC (stomatin/prohibitin superfamily)